MTYDESAAGIKLYCANRKVPVSIKTVNETVVVVIKIHSIKYDVSFVGSSIQKDRDKQMTTAFDMVVRFIERQLDGEELARQKYPLLTPA